MQADDEQQESPDNGGTGGFSPGQRLRAAREDRGMSVDEVAHDLRLDRDVILALEEDDFDRLGAPVFVKGYLRSYARLLNVPESDVVEVVQVAEPEPEEFRTLSTQREVKPGANLVNFILWVALGIIVLLGAAYLLMGDDPEPAGVAEKGDFVVPEPAAELPEPVAPAGEVAEEAPVAAQPDEVVPVLPDNPEPEVPPEPASPPTVELSLVFGDECWVEISDARRRLVYGLEKAGKVVRVDGTPPFKLFLGNVKAVELSVNGTVFPIPGAGSARNTARFVIAADDIP